MLWTENFDNHVVTDDDNRDKVIEHFSQYSNWISLYDALAMFFVKHGPICSTGDVKKILKDLEREKRLAVQRKPDVKKNGTPTTFMTEGKGQTVSVRWVR